MDFGFSVAADIVLEVAAGDTDKDKRLYLVLGSLTCLPSTRVIYQNTK